MAIPHRGWTSTATYFITASTFQHRNLLQSDRIAELFLEGLYHYRGQKYSLHEFVVMPDHVHLLINPLESLERAMQCIKGSFSFRAKRECGYVGEIWESSYYDHRVRDSVEYARMRTYIHENPVRRHLVERAEDYLYSSANTRWELDEVPQRLKPAFLSAARSQS